MQYYAANHAYITINQEEQIKISQGSAFLFFLVLLNRLFLENYSSTIFRDSPLPFGYMFSLL
jgi:hypothetical protein